MDAWTLTKDETPPATGRKVAVWMEGPRGEMVAGTYAESVCDAGEDARGYWLDEEGNELSPPVRWMLRKE